MHFFYGSIITISVPNSYTLTKIEFTKYKDQPFNSDATCNGASFAGTCTFQEPTTTAVIKNGGIGETAGTGNKVEKITVWYKQQPAEAPTPVPQISSYDSSSNTATLCVKDAENNTIENASILYAITPDRDEPLNLIPYDNTPIRINNIIYPDCKYYLWAQTQLDNSKSSPVEIIGEYEIELTSNLPTVTFTRMANDNNLTENNWFIITTVIDGKLYAMGSEQTDGSHKLVLVNNDIETVTAQMNGFESLGILEFTVSQGHFVEKNSQNFLKPTVNSRALSANIPSNTSFTIDGTGKHSLEIDGQKLGASNNAFDFGLPGEISLYETGSSINTSTIDNICNNDDSEATYYNLLGIEVKSPTNGLYIKRQGKNVMKVIVR